mmetsp:Transcript_35739/g.87962  ORF Transcript_35739/g.87962 Transcript_35739/m.87962 type:complete len:239 (-) Transcript_35739:313-1029(-)
MRARDEVEAVGVVELLADVLPERVPGAARRDAPPAPVVRVAPQQVAHGALVRHLLRAPQLPDVLQRVQARAQPSVRAEDLVVDGGGQRQVVEHVRDVLPHVGVAVLAQALVVEPVHLGDLAALVVAPQQEHPPRPPRLHGHDGADGLHAVVAPVHVVTQEQVVGVRTPPADLHQLHQVRELPVDVPHHRDRRGHRHHILLLGEHLLGLLANHLHLLLREDLPLQQLLDLSIELRVWVV